jgi:ribonuclease HI
MLSNKLHKQPINDLDHITHQLHPNTILALQSTEKSSLTTNNEPKHLHIFYDGSYTPPQGYDTEQPSTAKAGAAFVILQQHDEQVYTFTGVASIPCTTDTTSPYYTYIDDLSPYNSENTACIHALLWLITNMQQYNITTATLHGDSKHCNGTATSTNRFNAYDQQHCAQITRSLTQILEQHIHIQYQHVKSHEGQPWNELADVLAKLASNNNYYDDAITKFPFQHFTDPLQQLPWLWTQHPKHTHSMPNLQLQHFTYPNNDPSKFLELVQRHHEKPKCHQSNNYQHQLKIATANVLTLYEGYNKRKQLHARSTTLQEQFHKSNYNIIFIQETLNS